MVVHNVPENVIEILADYLQSESPQRRGRFTAEMKKYTEAQQQYIISELKKREIEPETSKSTNEYECPEELDQEDWKNLTDLSWSIRKNDPQLSLQEIIRKAQDSLPKEKRRKLINLSKYGKLINSLKDKDSKAEKSLERNQQLTEEINLLKESIQTRDQILQTLSDEELFAIAERVISLLSIEKIAEYVEIDSLLEYASTDKIVSCAISKFLSAQEKNVDSTNLMFKRMAATIQELSETLQGMQQPHKTIPVPIVKKLPKVIVFGLKSDQQQEISRELREKANFTFVDKNRKANVEVKYCDFIFLFAKWIDHGIENYVRANMDDEKTQLIVHHGGISEAISHLKTVLK